MNEINDVYVVFETTEGIDWYVSDYSVTQGQVAVSKIIRDARKLNKYEADYVAEYFGMHSIKIEDMI